MFWLWVFGSMHFGVHARERRAAYTSDDGCARLVVRGHLSAGCAPCGCTWRLSRAARGQPVWVFWRWVFAARTLVCRGSTGSVHLDDGCARLVVRGHLSVGYASDGRTGRLSRAACGQPDWVFWCWVFAARISVSAHGQQAAHADGCVRFVACCEHLSAGCVCDTRHGNADVCARGGAL